MLGTLLRAFTKKVSFDSELHNLSHLLLPLRSAQKWIFIMNMRGRGEALAGG